jgi:hypothetical protein
MYLPWGIRAVWCAPSWNRSWAPRDTTADRVLVSQRQIGHHALLRIQVMCALSAVILVSCGSAHNQLPSDRRVPQDDPAAILQAAAHRSLGTSSAALHGASSAHGLDQVVFSGAIDFAEREDSLSISPAPGVASYPPFDVRFVGGQSYVEIDDAVKRPPTLHPGTRWIEFDQNPGAIPVPDRAMPPKVPIDTVGLPLAQPMIDARFLGAAARDQRRVSVRFARGPYSGVTYIYSIDSRGLIVALEDTDPTDAQGLTLAFDYGPTSVKIVAPVIGVQRVGNGEYLYPTPTTAPTA